MPGRPKGIYVDVHWPERRNLPPQVGLDPLGEAVRRLKAKFAGNFEVEIHAPLSVGREDEDVMGADSMAGRDEPDGVYQAFIRTPVRFRVDDDAGLRRDLPDALLDLLRNRMGGLERGLAIDGHGSIQEDARPHHPRPEVHRILHAGNTANGGANPPHQLDRGPVQQGVHSPHPQSATHHQDDPCNRDGRQGIRQG